MAEYPASLTYTNWSPASKSSGEEPELPNLEERGVSEGTVYHAKFLLEAGVYLPTTFVNPVIEAEIKL
jgi:hypothetical protein